MVKNSRAATIIPNLVLLGRLSIRKILRRYTDTMAGNIGPSHTIVDLNLGYMHRASSLSQPVFCVSSAVFRQATFF
jgi:hypothetical protein